MLLDMLSFKQYVLIYAFIAAATVAVHAQSSSDEPRNEVEVRGVYSIPSGDANFSGTADSGSTISFSRDFEFRNKLGFELRYTYRSANGKHKLMGDFSQTSFNRSTTLSRSFTFRDQTYLANLAISGDLRVRQFRAMYAYRWGNEKIRIGPMADIGAIGTRLIITGTTNSGTRSAEGSITSFVATLGYDLDYNPTSKVRIFNNLGAIAFQGEHFFRVEGGLNYYPSRHVGISGGYKAARYKLVDDPNFIRVKTHGPFFGGIVRF
jgi:hypothetical protein